MSISYNAGAWKIKPLTGKYSATFIVVLTAFILAFCNGSGKGALLLWPLFGTVNQLLAGLALLVITIYFLYQLLLGGTLPKRKLKLSAVTPRRSNSCIGFVGFFN